MFLTQLGRNRSIIAMELKRDPSTRDFLCQLTQFLTLYKSRSYQYKREIEPILIRVIVFFCGEDRINTMIERATHLHNSIQPIT